MSSPYITKSFEVDITKDEIDPFNDLISIEIGREGAVLMPSYVAENLADTIIAHIQELRRGDEQ